MQYGIGHLSVAPLRIAPDNSSEMITQVLYGDHFKVKEERKFWSRIQLIADGCEGWLDNRQLTKINEETFLAVDAVTKPTLSQDLLSYIATKDDMLCPIVLGSRLDVAPLLNHKYEEEEELPVQNRSNLVNTAFLYLNAPFLWGGKTPIGIDSAGLTQMVYKLNGVKLLRTTQEQARQGDALSFIEESEPGDLAFFDNSEGIIDHVGIILKDNYIIHAYGKVRIDRIDHTGIFNTEENRYSHQLRVIKKIL